MRLFKWIGAGVLLFCAFLFSRALVAFERRRCEEAKGMLALLSEIRAGVDRFSLPLREAVKSVKKETLTLVGYPGERTGDLSALIAASGTDLPREIGDMLSDVATAVTASAYRDEQLRAIDEGLARLTPLCEGLQTSLSQRVKLARWLPPLGAAILILILF